MVNKMEVRLVRKKDFFEDKEFHLFIYNKTESATGLHRHDYYEYTLILTGMCYQEVNGKRVFLERGDFVFIPIGSHHQSFYEFGATRILNVCVSKAFFEKHYGHLLLRTIVASQAYRLKGDFLSYIESAISAAHVQDDELTELLELLTFYVTNRICHYKETAPNDDIPLWLKTTVDKMHDKSQFSEKALANMVALSGKTQEYLTRATQRFYQKTPMQIINEIRINFAKTQLEVTNYLVSDIAFEAGYSDSTLFIKNFKKLTSFTPGNYRKKFYGVTERLSH
ncbi:transcriptional regulator ChbR [Yersinia ruckeri]|uniref:transcriptional regulator ChbR n=2 Tax=Yersinia ruckeri TaxID=29486 RepID=UPI000907CEAE|nr:transcriptional regulator ChbR [Yersinia ruckeri]AUQ42865.1 transcriptional regulator ChbR [Yersinia ruckeri]EKN4693575.1 transcriptional regulator ChbR [Yersinia ruckeri]WMS04549.1 transcriptional regulator ChbR [Yersinia ruckeri]